MTKQPDEPQFHDWRVRFLKRGMLLCLIAIPVGFIFLGKSPATTLIVSGLGAIGVTVGFVKLQRLRA